MCVNRGGGGGGGGGGLALLRNRQAIIWIIPPKADPFLECQRET